jgi:hypothetical protein
LEFLDFLNTAPLVDSILVAVRCLEESIDIDQVPTVLAGGEDQIFDLIASRH